MKQLLYDTMRANASIGIALVELLVAAERYVDIVEPLIRENAAAPSMYEQALEELRAALDLTS